MSIDWTELYRTTFPDLVRSLHRKVWDPDQARDLAQEAFVRALAHKPAKPRPWLFKVAANLARDEARSVVRRKRHLALLKSEADLLREDAPDPARELAKRERQETVRRALESLGEGQNSRRKLSRPRKSNRLTSRRIWLFSGQPIWPPGPWKRRSPNGS